MSPLPTSSPTNLGQTSPAVDAALEAKKLENQALENQALENQALETQVRKADHLRICLDEDVQSHRITNGLERYRFTHCCLPELNRDVIDISTTFLG